MPIYLTYYFWLMTISAFVFTLERLFPRDPKQEILRDGFVQDLFWMIFNTQYVAWMLAVAAVHTLAWFNGAVLHLGLPAPESLRLIATWPVWLQFTVVFLLRDFLEWNIHRTLHRVPWLWRFHQLHHSIEQLDWATTFRAHWGEIVLYKILVYVPLVILGVSDGVIFAIIAVSLLIQEFAHANLSWDWGPLGRIVTSPRFHAWHHDVELHRKHGQNFGVSLAIWDWLFRTAHWPADKSPIQYGVPGMKDYPKGIWARLWEPFSPATPRVAPATAKLEKKETVHAESMDG
jgi:sterol desaturase/sphingolipid hydroxylase (fatty acid hydroxylase superfamily)